jgi:hypothetical protein
MVTEFAGSAAEDCNKCISDCDDPPPSHPDCGQYCFPTYNCWPCQGWEIDCYSGDCEDLVGTYFEGELECGVACPDNNNMINPPPCGSGGGGSLLDGTVALIQHGVGQEGHESGQLRPGVAPILTDIGMLYRRDCDGAVVARNYTPAAAADVMARLEVVEL